MNKLQIRFAFIIIFMIIFTIKIFSQSANHRTISLKIHYNTNFSHDENINFGQIEIAPTIWSLNLSPSIRFRKHELFFGPQISLFSDGTSGSHTTIPGWHAGYNYFLRPDTVRADFFLFYLINFDKRHVVENFYSHGSIDSRNIYKESVLSNILGFGSKVNLGKKTKTYFYFTLGYSFVKYLRKGETMDSGTQTSESRVINRFSWSHWNTSLGFSFNLKDRHKYSNN